MAETALPTAPTKENSDSTSDDPSLALLTDLAGVIDSVGTIIENLTHLHGTDGTKAAARTNLGLKAQAVDDGAAIQKQTYTYWEDTGTTNALVITPTPAITTLSPGLRLTIKVKNAISGAATVKFNDLDPISIKMPSGENPASGEIASNQVIEGVVYYTGSVYQFVVLSAVTSTIILPSIDVVLIESVDLSSLSTVDFTTDLDLYDHYEIRISQAVPQGLASSFGLRTSADGGSTWDAGVGYDNAQSEVNGGAVSPTTSSGVSSITMFGPFKLAGSPGLQGKISFGNLSGTDAYKHFSYDGTWYKNGGSTDLAFTSGGGLRKSTAAIDGVRLLLSASTFASGRASLYGYKTS